MKPGLTPPSGRCVEFLGPACFGLEFYNEVSQVDAVALSDPGAFTKLLVRKNLSLAPDASDEEVATVIKAIGANEVSAVPGAAFLALAKLVEAREKVSWDAAWLKSKRRYRDLYLLMGKRKSALSSTPL